MKTKRCSQCKRNKNIDQFTSASNKDKILETCRYCRTRVKINKSKRAYLQEWEEMMETWEPVIKSQM